MKFGPKTSKAHVAALLCGALLSACGGGGESTSAGSTTAPSAGGSTSTAPTAPASTSTAASTGGPNIVGVSDIAVAEGTKAQFEVDLSGRTLQASTVKFTLDNGTAVGGQNFSTALEVSDDGGATYKTVASGGTATIREGITSFAVRVSTLANSSVGPTKTYSLYVTPVAGLGTVTGHGMGQISEGKASSSTSTASTATTTTTASTGTAAATPTPAATRPTTASAAGSTGAPTLTPSGPVHTNTMVRVTTAGTVIDGHTFDGNGSGNSCLYVSANNVTVKNSVFRNCKNHALAAEGVTGFVADHNTFTAVGNAILLQGSSSNNRITNNRCDNLSSPDKTASCVKLNGVRGSGNVLANNSSFQDKGVGNTEDIFSVFDSAGTSASPIAIDGNCVDGANNTSSTGTSFNIGDMNSAWLHALDNTVINRGGGSFSGGMGVNGGHNITIENHRVWCRGVNTGQQQWCQMATWDYYKLGCSNITIKGAQVDVKDGSGNQVDAYIDYGGCKVTMTNNNFKASIAQPVCK